LNTVDLQTIVYMALKDSRPPRLGKALLVGALLLELAAGALIVTRGPQAMSVVFMMGGIVLFAFGMPPPSHAERSHQTPPQPPQPERSDRTPTPSPTKTSRRHPGVMKNGMPFKEYSGLLANQFLDSLNRGSARDPAPKHSKELLEPMTENLTRGIKEEPAPPSPPGRKEPMLLRDGTPFREWAANVAKELAANLNRNVEPGPAHELPHRVTGDAVPRRQGSSEGTPTKPRAWVVERLKQLHLPEVTGVVNPEPTTPARKPPDTPELDEWGLRAKRQWKLDAPKLYAAYEADGTLREHLYRVQEDAKASMALLVEQGLDETGAEELAEQDLFRYDPGNEPDKPEDWERELGEQNMLDAMDAFLKSIPSKTSTPKK
jgi:hypothetical protein